MKRKFGMMVLVFTSIFTSLTCNSRNSEERIRIATWNVKDIFTVEDVRTRSETLRRMAEEVKPDILCIQEITSHSIAGEIKKVMGFEEYHIACSDFVQSDGANRSSFEVAVLSKFPITEILEFDRSPDNVEEDPPEESLIPPEIEGIGEANFSRGFLWVRIDDLKITLSVVHLKSSTGLDGLADSSNAIKREICISAVADRVLEDQETLPEYTSVVLGDFNVGHSDLDKNGADLTEDCYDNCMGRDGYDETHALLSVGLVRNLMMKNMAISITQTTFPGFEGSPIDNIYVVGPSDNKFSAATLGTNTYGSDHLPVWTEFTQ
jgi:endonuclease/exonuclease/phosphatase family metal-dependent hydrolase